MGKGGMKMGKEMGGGGGDSTQLTFCAAKQLLYS